MVTAGLDLSFHPTWTTGAWSASTASSMFPLSLAFPSRESSQSHHSTSPELVGGGSPGSTTPGNRKHDQMQEFFIVQRLETSTPDGAVPVRITDDPRCARLRPRRGQT
jgi:hypothetical protein